MGLSPKEREGLLNRPTNSHERATNDVRVRKKLAAWLKEADDIKLIFENLPKDQLRKEISGDHFEFFLNLAICAMKCLDIGRIEGKIDEPYEWAVVIDEKNKRLATDSDIIDALSHNDRLNVLQSLSSPVIEEALFLDKLDKSPKFHDRVTDSERNGIERVNKAIKDYVKEFTEECNREYRAQLESEGKLFNEL
jgi:hypothetical protein